MKFKKIVIISIILLAAFLCFNNLICEYDDFGVRSIDKVRGKLLAVAIAESVLNYQSRNNGRYPKSLSEITLDELSDIDGCLGTPLKRKLDVMDVSFGANSKIVDICRFYTVYVDSESKSLIIIISPFVFGAQHIPVLICPPSSIVNFKLNLKEVKYEVITSNEISQFANGRSILF